MRRRSASYSPPPRRGFGARGARSPSPRGRYPSRREPPTSLLVRNLSKDCRADDLRGPFGQFGPMRDVYLPKDYYTGEPRGFGFVQYLDPFDAEDAQYYMNHQILHGREITVVFAEENRKKPIEMRAKERVRERIGYDSRDASPYYAQSRSHSRHRSRSVRHRHYSRSPSPDVRKGREYSRSRSPEHRPRFPSPPRSTRKKRERSPSGSRSSQENDTEHTPSGKDNKSRSVKHSPFVERDSRPLPRSPSLPPRRRRSSHSRNSESGSPEAHANYGRSHDEAASPDPGLN
eukprot:c26687_g1_i2 orf=370-1236(+)